MRVFGRDLIREGHYGQRSCEPQLKAEHMAAPTNPAKREESSCQLGAVHTWHEAAAMSAVRSLSGAKRTWCEKLISVEIDPKWAAAFDAMVLGLVGRRPNSKASNSD